VAATTLRDEDVDDRESARLRSPHGHRRISPSPVLRRGCHHHRGSLPPVIQCVIKESGGSTPWPMLTKTNYNDWSLLMKVNCRHDSSGMLSSSATPSSMRTGWHWTLSLPLSHQRWCRLWRTSRPPRTPVTPSSLPHASATIASERRRCRSCARSGTASRSGQGRTLTTSLSASPAWCNSWRDTATSTSMSKRRWRSTFTSSQEVHLDRLVDGDSPGPLGPIH
jgi:hypothetical protein